MTAWVMASHHSALRQTAPLRTRRQKLACSDPQGGSLDVLALRVEAEAHTGDSVLPCSHYDQATQTYNHNDAIRQSAGFASYFNVVSIYKPSLSSADSSSMASRT